jgi:membrane protein implicated in regulation of membrane protease activity
MIDDDRAQFTHFHAPGLVLISVAILALLAGEAGLKVTFVTFVLASLVWVVTGRGLARRNGGGDES